MPGNGMVTIASSAAIYQPTYYFAVGWVTHFTEGTRALRHADRLRACAALSRAGRLDHHGVGALVWPLLAAAASPRRSCTPVRSLRPTALR